MEKSNFVMHTEYMEHIQLLDMDQRGVLLTALMLYQMGEELPEMDAVTQMCFSFMKARIDRDNEAYEEKCRKNAENGSKGGRPKKPNGSDEKRTVSEKTERFSEKPKKADTDTDTDTDIDIKEKESKKKKPAVFTPPTVAEVDQYAREKGYSIDSQRFVDFYECKGWMVGKNKMKDWKAAVRNWASRERERPPRPTKFSNYTSDRKTDQYRNGLELFG